MEDYPFSLDSPDQIKVSPVNWIDNVRWQAWVDSGEIGYVHLCFAILLQAINDFFYGDHLDVIDAAFFFGVYDIDNYSTEYGSRYPLIQKVLEIEGLPVLIQRYYERGTIPSLNELEAIEKAFKTMTIDSLNENQTG